MYRRGHTPLDNAAANREAIDRIKSLYLRGKISREVAEALATPVIAKKYGKRRYPKTTFIGLMR
jgi:hypothetical protein